MKNWATAAFVLLFAVIGSTAHAEIVLGRWCDEPASALPKLNMIITLYSEGDTTFSRIELADGGELQKELRELGNGVFAQVDSSSGDKYRIVKSTGDLQLLDDDGYIRTASRLENTPQPGDCLR